MSQKTQNEIINNTKIVLKGLEAMREEHVTLMTRMKEHHGDNEKLDIIMKNIVHIDLGVDEIQVMMTLASHLQNIDIERSKLKIQVRRLSEENEWLRDELTSTQQKLHTSEQQVAQLEEEKKHLEFMASIKKYDEYQEQEDTWEKSLSDPVVELFPDEENEERHNMFPNSTNEMFGYEFTSRLHTLHSLVIHYASQRRYEIAVPLCKQALEELEKTTDPNHPDVAAMLNILALLYQDLKRYKESANLLHKALSIRRKTFGEYHHAVVATLNNLALLHRQCGKYKDAESFCKQALEIREKVLGKDHPKVAKQLNNLASLYYEQKKYEEVEKCYERSLEIFKSTLGPNDLNVDKTKSYLASLYLKQGKHTKAQILYKQH